MTPDELFDLSIRASRREQRAVSYRSSSARARVFDDALREAMSAPVPDAIQPESASASDPAAGTPSPEGVAVERVAAVPAVRDTGFEADDGNRVEHPGNVTSRLGDEPGCDTPSEPHTEKETGRRKAEGLSRSARSAGSEAAEAQRLSRLRRWQAVGERRT